MVSRVSTHVWSRLSYKSGLGSSHFLLLLSSLLPSGTASQLYTPLPISSNFSPFVNTKITTFPEGLFNEIKGERTPSPSLYDTEAQPLLLRSPPSQIKTARCLWASSQNWTSLGSPWITSCSSGSTGSRESRFVFSFFRVGFRSSKLIVSSSSFPPLPTRFFFLSGAPTTFDTTSRPNRSSTSISFQPSPVSPISSYCSARFRSTHLGFPSSSRRLRRRDHPRPRHLHSHNPHPSRSSLFSLGVHALLHRHLGPYRRHHDEERRRTAQRIDLHVWKRWRYLRAGLRGEGWVDPEELEVDQLDGCGRCGIGIYVWVGAGVLEEQHGR